MNKKNLVIVSILFIFLLTACGTKSNETDIELYLKNNFPNETFEIISSEYIENVKDDCNKDNDSKNKNDGQRYIVKSNTTNITFEVEDIYELRSGGFCSYELKDNYYQTALDKYIKEFGDSRITLYTEMLSSDIKVNYEDFISLDEISKVLYNFKNFYEEKHPFTEDAKVRVYIFNSDKQITSFNLSYNREMTLNDIKIELENSFK